MLITTRSHSTGNEGMLFDGDLFLRALTTPALLRGAGVALVLSILVQIASFVACLPVALSLGASNPGRRALANVYVWVFRAAPLLLVLLIVWNGVPQLFPSLMRSSWFSPFFGAFLAMGFVTTAYMAEIMRGAFLAIDTGQSDAALALGLRPLKVFALIILPQAMRIALPALVNEFINLVKLTSLAYVISLREIMAVVNDAIANSFRFVEWYSAALIYYLVIVSLLMIVQARVERRFRSW